MASTNKPDKTPPIISVSGSPWGEISEEEYSESTRDAFYVDGYTDRRQEFDLTTRTGGKAPGLPYRFQYVSVERATGQPDNNKAAYYRSRGYVPVLYDEASKWDIHPEKSGFVRGTDGTCRVGSQMLMVCPAPKVAVHARKLREDTANLSETVKAKADAAAESFNREHGLTEGTAFEFEEHEFKVREKR